MTTCPVCHYFYVHDWEEKDDNVLALKISNMQDHKKKFIHINGTFLVDNSSYHGGEHRVALLACPNCNCVQMSDD